jgi:hypothetical protein
MWLQEAGAKPGLACAAYFGYMKGVKNALAMKHVPWVLPRNDTRAGGWRGGRPSGGEQRPVLGLHRAAAAHPAAAAASTPPRRVQGRGGGVETRWAATR